MKIILLFVLLICNSVLFGQCNDLWKMKSFQVGFDVKKNREVYKIRRKKFTFKFDEGFYLKNKLLVPMPNDSFYYMELYEKRYLFVSYYKQEETPSTLAYWLRGKHRVGIFDLQNIERNWTFDFEGYDSHDFYFFDPEKAIVEIYNGVKLKPIDKSNK